MNRSAPHATPRRLPSPPSPHTDTYVPEKSISDLMTNHAGKGQEQVAAKEWLTQNQAAVDAWFAG